MVKKKEKEVKYVSQWYWDYDYLGNKYKAFYHGPRLDWMYLLDKNEKKDTKKNS